MNRKRWICVMLAGAMVFLLPGCQVLMPPVADPTRHYVLDVSEYAPASEAVADEQVVIGLARVRVARYLEDPGIAVREEGTRILYSQRHRWAESLEHGLTRLLTETLNDEPVVARVVQLPAVRPLPDVDLHVSVTRAEGVRTQAGARAVFRASWELRAGIDGRVVARGETREDDLPWDGENFEQLAGSLSQGVAELTREVAHALGGG